MILELSSFDNAILRLDEGIQRYEKDITDIQIRDGLIQRFEFTYELSHKMLKRFLESTSPSPAEIDELAFQDLIRTGNEQGLLLSDWAHWKKYREMRARTSHTYDESVALQVVSEIPTFLKEAQFLNAQLHSRNK
ncbi:nucleotidyltransferase substrate binding protein [Limnobacter alexandrii]|jgi:nucleotidyltransferase substrate binding protein (TIGR01987 family)|uniref:nucleotidyltransferase substrate binding protein n=1 Tax=Limnobacter alexandrii TaxID=2570352 RepID=UPI001108AEB4|nr:nucleotidyltransferase substrate binding protein [Limnobacter alexandrii]